MLVWKLWNLLVSSIEEAVDRECIRLIDSVWAGNYLEHGACDDIGVDDCQVEGWLRVFHVLPCCLLS